MAKKSNKSFEEKVNGMFNDVKDSTKDFTKKDMEDNKGMAILSYIIPLIPYFVEKKSKWVKYHAVQGMNLLIIGIIANIALSIVTAIIWPLWWLTNLLWAIFNGVYFVLAVIGIINVCNGKAKELPIVNKFKIIK